MNAVLPVHDNLLASYTVDGRAKQITLHTVSEKRGLNERTDVVFGGVVAYHFEGDTLGTIIFDVFEAPLQDIYSAYEHLFLRLRDYGWPPVPNGSIEELLEALRLSNARGYLFSSSYGMSGFVLAESLEFHPA